MINLIPKEEKKKMIADFYFRLAILITIMLNFCILIAFFSLLPSYFISSIKHSLINERLENLKLEPLPSSEESSLNLMKDIDNKIISIEKFEKNKFLPSVKIINAILLRKTPNIKITKISYEKNGLNEKKISISGIAPSREALLSFRKALEESSTFKNVNLPISNFVKGYNINFNLSLSPS